MRATREPGKVHPVRLFVRHLRLEVQGGRSAPRDIQGRVSGSTARIAYRGRYAWHLEHTQSGWPEIRFLTQDQAPAH